MADQKYENLKDLLLNNERAKHFYNELPNTTQVALSVNSDEICSMEALRGFVHDVEKNKH